MIHLGVYGLYCQFHMAIVEEDCRVAGWSLVRKNPEMRLKDVHRVMAEYPAHYVVVVYGLNVNHCGKFLVKDTIILNHFLYVVQQLWDYTEPYHIIFEGVSFPKDNLIFNIYKRLSRDDGILYGRLIRLNTKIQVSTVPHH